MMAVETESMRMLMQAISAVQRLRESVNKTFSSLHGGVKSTTSDEATPTEEKVKQFVAELPMHLCSVNDNFGELERVTKSLGRLSQGLGATGILSLDPVLDKMPMYQQILQTYKWSSKLKEHSSHAVSILNQNLPMKRFSNIAGKKRKMQPPNFNPQLIDQIVLTLNRQYMDALVVTKIPNNFNVYQVTLGRTFCAVIGLRKQLIERVVIRGKHENISLDERMIDIWAPSKHKVFKKITDHATSAMLHYHLPHRPDLSFSSYIRWLHSYQKLFSSPCRQCGQYLQNNLPPTWHDFRNFFPYHEGCRP